jgi:cullin 1
MFPDDKPNIPLDEGWNDIIVKKALDPLVAQIEKGFTQKTKVFTNKVYSEIYSIVHDMCTQVPDSCSSELYTRHGEYLEQYLTATVLPALRTLENSGGTGILQALVRRGDNHSKMNAWMSKFFFYLDRFHCEYNHLRPLSEVGLEKFKILVFDEVKKSVCNTILVLINQERDGETIDRSVIRESVRLFEQMGLGSLDVYINDFEEHFLESTKTYYASKANEWNDSLSTPDYLICAEKAIDSEKARVSAYLNIESEERTLAVVIDTVLKDKEDEIINKENSGCLSLFRNYQIEHLERLYKLYCKVTNGIQPIADLLKKHILECAETKIDERKSRIVSGTSKSKKDEDDPTFMNDIITIHDVNIKLINDIFNQNTLFQKAIKDAFETFINHDIGGKEKSAAVMSAYCDHLLKGKSSLNDEAEIETFLDKTIVIFSYLSDKDIFAEIYRGQLYKRLLNETTTNTDLEAKMISKLDYANGQSFTAKMVGMLHDMKLSETSSNQFNQFYGERKTHYNIKSDSVLSMQFLTKAHWPEIPKFNIILPPAMSSMQECYKEFFNKTYQTKRVHWYYSLGSAEVRGHFPQPKIPYIDFKLATLQCVALLNFNSLANGDEYSFQDLLAKTSFKTEILKRVMDSLTRKDKDKKGKILLNVLRKISPAPTTELAPGEKAPSVSIEDCTFAVNDKYKCESRSKSIKMAAVEDSLYSLEAIEIDRSHAIDAAIVRIMKARKQLDVDQLVMNVMEQLNTFNPNRKVIKKRIDGLIAREYLARDGPTSLTYDAGST